MKLGERMRYESAKNPSNIDAGADPDQGTDLGFFHFL